MMVAFGLQGDLYRTIYNNIKLREDIYDESGGIKTLVICLNSTRGYRRKQRNMIGNHGGMTKKILRKKRRRRKWERKKKRTYIEEEHTRIISRCCHNNSRTSLQLPHFLIVTGTQLVAAGFEQIQVHSHTFINHKNKKQISQVKIPAYRQSCTVPGQGCHRWALLVLVGLQLTKESSTSKNDALLLISIETKTRASYKIK
jgi:hypothetical protein